MSRAVKYYYSVSSTVLLTIHSSRAGFGSGWCELPVYLGGQPSRFPVSGLDRCERIPLVYGDRSCQLCNIRAATHRALMTLTAAPTHCCTGAQRQITAYGFLLHRSLLEFLLPWYTIAVLRTECHGVSPNASYPDRPWQQCVQILAVAHSFSHGQDRWTDRQPN